MDSREFEAALNDLEKRIDRLRALYEQYFRGYERIEPLIPRKDFERRLYALRKAKPRNTAMRFRFQQLMQRYTMFTTRWGRLTRQIEEGTHPLVLERARRRRQRAELTGRTETPLPDAPEGETPDSYELDLNEDLNLDELLSEAELTEVAAAIDKPGPHRATQPPRAVATFGSPKSGVGSRPRPASTDDSADDDRETGRHAAVTVDPPTRRPPAPAPTTAHRSFKRPAPTATPSASGPRSAPRPVVATGLKEDRVRAIYNEFVQARRANNESANVKYETVARRIETMLPELRKKHGGRDIDFDVVVRNGRVGLRPRTR